MNVGVHKLDHQLLTLHDAYFVALEDLFLSRWRHARDILDSFGAARGMRGVKSSVCLSPLPVRWILTTRVRGDAIGCTRCIEASIYRDCPKAIAADCSKMRSASRKQVSGTTAPFSTNCIPALTKIAPPAALVVFTS